MRVARIQAFVQARTSSSRLPGKVLREIGGKPLLAYLLESLAQSHLLDAVAVATSRESSDDVVARFCEQHGVACFRGPLEDVAQRFVLAGEASGCDAFVRISGDSPLMDFRVVDEGIRTFQAGGLDLATNVMPRSFPAGVSIEVLDYPVFREAYRRMTKPEHFEHVTLYYYHHPEEFRIGAFAAPVDRSRERLTVDTEEELEKLERIVAKMDRPHYEYSYEQILALASE